ncbi:MAG: hypothetical protein EON91_02730 [Brevundimonas sp.]|uniref:DUF6950 family protein n=1 Tax=Brevundimonas sp. TaxID=1871086 RepID=UPI00122048FB|nr:hypothetical protein [Brevundimonas sp.]RZJ19129.1 MAG: hypothetical protein EON91_02730 [Brevundimonas sp.]
MLSAFLEEMACRPFVDGERDCALTVADWVMTATGCPDPAAHLRGRYRTALGRERLLRKLGGLEAVMADCAAKASLAEVTNPVRGDVGLIEAGRRGFAAICLGGRWAVKGLGVEVLTPDRVIRAWGI